MININGHQSQAICENYCQCNLCDEPQHLLIQKQQIQDKQNGINSMQKLLQHVPRNFPLLIIPTAFQKSKTYYFNKFGNRIATMSFNKITQHFPLATNILIFYNSSTKITYKYQMIRENQNFIYIQAYSTQVPLTIRYHRDDQHSLDKVLTQKILQLVQELTKDQYYNYSQKSKQFLKWVSNEYGDQKFCAFFTQLLFKFLQKVSGTKFISATLNWLVQKNGGIRLSNVKDLNLIKPVIMKSFQEEYEEKILQKLSDKNNIQIKLFNSASRQSPQTNYRVKNFRNKIHKIYLQEKISIQKNTQKQRNNQTKNLSDEIARLFLPQLHHYSNLREVLNDQQKFKKVVLGIEPKKNKNLNSPIKSQNKNKPHFRSKTEV